VVWGVLRVEDGVSPNVGAAFIWTSLVGFTLLYGVLALVDVWLIRKFAQAGPTDEDTPEAVGASFTY
jgi:cytochrome d ubiquinol oxidase subunit I